MSASVCQCVCRRLASPETWKDSLWHLQSLLRGTPPSSHLCSDDESAFFVGVCFHVLAGLQYRASLWLAVVCVCVCFLFCSSQCSGKCSYKTVCQPVHSLSSMKSTHFPSVCLSSSLSLSLQPCILLHWLTSLFAGTWLYTHCIYAPHLNNQLSHLDTVSLQHTDLRVFERERSIQCQEIDWCLL